jgi:hypothetical protein
VHMLRDNSALRTERPDGIQVTVRRSKRPISGILTRVT